MATQWSGDDVAARYAPPRRRVPRWVWVGTGVVLAVAALASVSQSVLRDEVRWRDVAFTVVDDRTVRTTFEVYADPGDRIRCQVRAADERYFDVGQVDVDLGPLEGRATSVTTEIRTTQEAVSSSVRTCVRLP